MTDLREGESLTIERKKENWRKVRYALYKNGVGVTVYTSPREDRDRVFLALETAIKALPPITKFKKKANEEAEASGETAERKFGN